MRRMRMCMAAAAAAVALTGCLGNDDDPAGSASPADRARAQDAAAQSAARTGVSEIESCFATKQDYRKCTLAEAAAQIVEAGPATYTILAPSDSGSQFIVEKLDDGTVARTCKPPGEGGCSAAGDW